MKKILLLIIMIIILTTINTYASMIGDVDGDNKITSKDYIAIKLHILGKSKLTGVNFQQADLNNDNKISSLDYIFIRNILLKKLTLYIKNNSITLKTNEEQKINYSIFNNDKNTKISFLSDNKKIIDVTDDGTIKGIGIGKATVTIELKNTKEKISKKVNIKVIKENCSISLKEGKTLDIAKNNTKNINDSLQCAQKNNITTLVVPKGNYYFDIVNNPILIDYSNITLDLNNATFNVYPNNSPSYQLFLINNTNNTHNVVIKNGNLKGDRYEHTCSKGTWSCSEGKGFKCLSDEKPSHEWGHGIYISAYDVKIENLKISDMTGDGICIKTDYKMDEISKDYKIDIHNNIIENARRNGITIGCAKNVIIKNNVIRNMNGTRPQVGIDIERNNTKQFYEKTLIEGNTIYGNNRRISIIVHAGVKDYVKIINNKIGDQIMINNGIGAAELNKILVENNSVYDANNCVCNPNKPVIVASTNQRDNNCFKCERLYCEGRVVNGTVQK